LGVFRSREIGAKLKREKVDWGRKRVREGRFDQGAGISRILIVGAG